MENSITKIHLKYCFQSIINHINHKKLPKFPKTLEDKTYPIFVTWKIGKEKNLRGCIGTFSASPLSKLLQKYSLISAFQDTRFDPIKKSEIPDLHLSLSFLHDYQKQKKWDDWEIGVHGIIIEFRDNHGEELQATFLPEVAKEQGWDKGETVKCLVRKAGYFGDYRDVLKKIRLTSYRSLKGHMSYEEFKAESV